MLARICGGGLLNKLHRNTYLLEKRCLHNLVSSHNKHNTQSSQTTPQNPQQTTIDSSFGDPAFNKLDLSFDNPKEAFLSKYNSELVRSYFVFQMCSFNFLVDKNKEVWIGA